METQRNFLFITMLFLGALLWIKWVEFSDQQNAPAPATNPVAIESNQAAEPSTPTPNNRDEIPATPTDQVSNIPNAAATPNADLVVVETDLIKLKINPLGAVIESVELFDEPISLDQPDKGFQLLKKQGSGLFIAQDGLLSTGQAAPNHADTNYRSAAQTYSLGNAEELRVPFTWVSEDGLQFTKTFVFNRDSYVVDIEYSINNRSAAAWQGSIYAQFQSTEIEKQGGGFGQLPSFTGAAVYTESDKYQKLSYKDMRKEDFEQNTDSGWAAMLQHYFVAAWIPENGVPKTMYSASSKQKNPPTYRIGYKNTELTTVAAGSDGVLATSVYLGSKEQKRLKALQKGRQINGLALTVDYGFLTFLADPLFIGLSWIHGLVGNWGWAIILLTILIKIVFYPLSAASYKSMAGMKKLQPRMQTLKERYKDDRQKFQMEMMALYKQEKINPAGGCLPILIQIPVFIALYWVLLESVEMRHAPFALWLQDLSAPDPFFILPVLMGASMWLQQKLNPAPMDDIQKKVMMIMPIALTFLFLSFPQGLVLYWVVNNVLSIAQQWLINKRLAV